MNKKSASGFKALMQQLTLLLTGFREFKWMPLMVGMYHSVTCLQIAQLKYLLYSVVIVQPGWCHIHSYTSWTPI